MKNFFISSCICCVMMMQIHTGIFGSEQSEAIESLVPDEVSLLVGNTMKVTAPLHLKQPLQWSSDDVNIAEVDSQGIVTGKNTGVTTIYAIGNNGLKAACKLTVYQTTIGIVNLFKEKTDSMDVLFIGDSNFYRGVVPTEIWKKAGITSYVIGTPAQTIWQSYYLLKEALLYQKPKVVIYEVEQLYKKKTIKQDRLMHSIDGMKADSVRMEAVVDPVNGFSHNYIFAMQLDTIYKTFSKLKSISRPKEPVQPKYYKGYVLNLKVVPFQGDADFMNTNPSTLELDMDNMHYFETLITLCKDNGITLVLAKSPDAAEWSYEKRRQLNAFASHYGLTFYDAHTDMKNETIDWAKDTYDGGDHLNVFGALKYSRELAVYLNDNFQFTRTEHEEVIKSFDAGAYFLDMHKQSMLENNGMYDDGQ